MISIDWALDAACSPSDANLFTSDTKPPAREVTRLGLVCTHCPVQRECASWAVRHNETGFWAGVFIYPRGSQRADSMQALRRKAGVR